MPDALPVPVDPRRCFEHRIGPDSVGIDLELIPGSVVVERVDDDVQRVIPAHGLTLGQTAGPNLLRVGVPHPARHVKVIIVVEQVHRGLLGRLDVIRGPKLVHVLDERRVPPHGVVQETVDHGRRSRAHDSHDLVRTERRDHARALLCRGGRSRQEDGGAESYPGRLAIQRRLIRSRNLSWCAPSFPELSASRMERKSVDKDYSGITDIRRRHRLSEFFLILRLVHEPEPVPAACEWFRAELI